MSTSPILMFPVDEVPFIPAVPAVPTNSWVWGEQLLDLNGTSDYVDLGSNFDFGDGVTDNPFTLTAFVRPRDFSGFRLASKVGNSNNREWLFGFNSDQKLSLYLYDADKNDKIALEAVSANSQSEWLHIAASYDGTGAAGGITLYLNGAPVPTADISSGSFTAINDFGATVKVGLFYGSDYADGQVQSFNIYDQELTADEILQLYSGVVDNTPNPDVLDLVVNQDFNGTSDYIDLGTGYNFGDGATDQPFSVAATINPDASRFRLANKSAANGSTISYRLFTDQNRYLVFECHDDNGAFIGRQTDDKIPLDTWSHVVATYDGSSAGSGIKLYVDGAEVAITAAGGGGTYAAMHLSTDPLWLARTDDTHGTAYADGEIGEFQIFGHELTPAEVAALYHGAAKAAPKPDIFSVDYEPSHVSASFDGDNDYGEVVTNSNEQGTITLEAKFYARDTTGVTGIIGKWGDGNSNKAYALCIVSGDLRFYIQDGSDNGYVSFGVSTDTWYKVRAEYVAGTSIRLYVDDVMEDEATSNIFATLNDSTTLPLWVGDINESNATTKFDGEIEYARVVGVAEYEFTDRSYGSTVPDLSGNGNDLTITANNLLAFWRHYQHLGDGYNLASRGSDENYVAFDGVDGRADLGDTLNFGDGATDQPFTISATFRTDTLADYRIATKGTSGGNREWLLYILGDGRPVIILYDNGITSGDRLQTNGDYLTGRDGEWINVTATYDGTGTDAGLKLYVDGEYSFTSSNPGGSYVAMHDNSEDVYLSASGTSYRQGDIKSFRVWGRELTAEEVADQDAIAPDVANYRFSEGANNKILNQATGVDATLAGGYTWGVPRTTPDTPFSIEAYVDVQKLDDSFPIFDKGELRGTDQRSIRFGFNSTARALFYLRNGSDQLGINGNAALPSTGYYHVVGTYDGSATNAGLKFYVDGELIAVSDFNSGSYAQAPSTELPAKLGTWAEKFAVGDMQYVKAYSRELTADEVKRLYWDAAPVSATPVYAGDYTQDTVVIPHVWASSGLDYAPEADHHFSINQEFPGGTNVTGTVGVDLGSDWTFGDSLNDLPVSIVANIYPHSNDRFRIFSQQNPDTVGALGDRSAVFTTDTSGYLVLWYYDGDVQPRIGLRTDAVIAENVWSHVAFTYDGSGSNAGMELYINGEPAPSANAGVDVGNYVAAHDIQQPLLIGQWLDDAADGEIEYVKIFNRELSAAEMKLLYTGPFGGDSAELG